jgi:hypothetical protein
MLIINLPLVTAEALATVPTVADLPAGQPEGSIRYIEDIDTFYLFDGTTWFSAAGGLVTSVTDTATVNLTVTLGALSADVIQSGIDHGSISGLADDDHLQYHTDARALTWLGTRSTTDLAEGTNLYYTNTRADARITLQKGAANGLATLDAGSKIPVAQLPNSIMDYLGTWAASTNTPTLTNGTGSAGDVYIASDAGTVNFGAGNITFAAGDWVVYSGSIWEKSINSNAVASVNGFTGAVVLDTDDIAEATNLYFTDERAQDAVGTILASTSSVDLVYTDGTPEITATVLPAGVNHDALLNYDANDHIDHTTVSIATAANTSGLSGGGTIAATRNLVVDITGTTALGATADQADELMIYDVSATALKKITIAEIGATASGSANIRASEGAGTTTLTNADKRYQVFDLTADRNVDLPTTGVVAGDIWTMRENAGDFTLQIRSSGSNNIVQVRGGTTTLIALTNTPTTAADWSIASPGPVYGVQTNSTAVAGYVGEVVESIYGGTAVTDGVWSDPTSIVLEPGVWRIDYTARWIEITSCANAAISIGISTTSGNSSAGLVPGDNQADFEQNGSDQNLVSLSAYVYVNLAAQTTYYAKIFGQGMGGGTAQFQGKISAVRIR